MFLLLIKEESKGLDSSNKPITIMKLSNALSPRDILEVIVALDLFMGVGRWIV